MFFGKRFSGYNTKTISGLEILVLNIIKNNPGITGYEITHLINERFKGLWKGSAGTIYPLLKERLAEKGFVKISEIIEGSRLKKKYYITEKGENELKNVLDENIFPSMHSLMDYIFTIVSDFPRIKRNVETMFCSFPYHRSIIDKEVNESDLSLQNQKHIEDSIRSLKSSKKRLEEKISMIEDKIVKLNSTLENIRKARKEKSKPIEIIDDDLYS
ncbi:MAG: PadR family transcriptional regulator [Promethearchaeota archaeon]